MPLCGGFTVKNGLCWFVNKDDSGKTCVYVYVCVYIIYISRYLCVCVKNGVCWFVIKDDSGKMHVYGYVCVCVYIYIYTNIYICMYVCMYSSRYLCVLRMGCAGL
jgi:hypothetical protein